MTEKKINMPWCIECGSESSESCACAEGESASEKFRFYKLEAETGGHCIMTEEEMLEELKWSSEGVKWIIEIIELTKEEYEALPEFTGF